MNIDANFEHRASSSRGKHEGESSFALCDRLSRTRDNSQRQLPTDHDYAVPTREYQTDQSSLKPPRLLLALSSRKGYDNTKQQPKIRGVDTVTPYQGLALIDPFAIPSMERSCTLRCSATRMHRHTWITVAVGRSEPTTYSWACRSRSFRRERNGLTRSYVDQHIRFHRANPGIIVVRCEEGGSL
jgi:hypothetical protein